MSDYAALPGIKQGASFATWLDYTDLDGAALVFDPSELRASVRAPNGSLLTMLSIVIDPEGKPGRFLASATPAQTAKWPEGDVLFDVRRADQDGNVTSTDTVSIPVAKAESR